jgi:lysophospholipase L1-like esterase
LLLAAAACSSTPSVEEDRVLVVGDSLVNGTAPAITLGLTNEGWQPVVDGRPGWSIGRWAAVLAPVADLARARVAVVVLGTNDCAPECRDVDQGITRILHTLTDAGVERVLWLNVQEDADYPHHPDEVNGRLALAAARRPQLSIVDLSSALGGRPELHSDRVHFNEAGGLELTRLILDQLDRTR